ncbi:MAG: tripartite tricarboxylate transporter substrate binding protein [Oscillospiraceae bacterium]|nr:tripartite tricarboxylate transporter substrate binding protein [Oscillospiraceae bacterium]
MKRILALALVLVMALFAFAGCGATAASSAPASTATSEATSAPAASTTDWPKRDITMTVPWNPGGVTDLTVRAFSDELAKQLGVNVTIANTAGAAGSVGTIAVQDGPKDGYNLLGAGLQALVTYPVNGYTDVTYKEWTFFTMAYAPNVIVVPKDSPYNTLADLIAAAKSGTAITIGSAGVGSGGHTGAEILSQGAGFTYDHVPYDSGSNAVVATLSGEVDMNCQLITEVVDYIRSGDLKCLGVMSDKDLTIGEITIPSVLTAVPEMAAVVPMGETIALCVPSGVDQAIIDKLDEVMPAVAESKAFNEFCESKGMVVTYNGAATSQDYVGKLASLVDWTLYEGGTVQISPADFGIEKIG